MSEYYLYVCSVLSVGFLLFCGFFVSFFFFLAHPPAHLLTPFPLSAPLGFFFYGGKGCTVFLLLVSLFVSFMSMLVFQLTLAFATLCLSYAFVVSDLLYF